MGVRGYEGTGVQGSRGVGIAGMGVRESGDTRVYGYGVTKGGKWGMELR